VIPTPVVSPAPTPAPTRIQPHTSVRDTTGIVVPAADRPSAPGPRLALGAGPGPAREIAATATLAGAAASAAHASTASLAALISPTIETQSAARRHSHSARRHFQQFLPAAAASQAAIIISRFVQVIPSFVWILLAASLALAAVAGAAAYRSTRHARRQAESLAAVSAAALTDQLTGVLNRRGFLEAADRELARARRYQRPFALAYVDIRGLKAVNDTQGHLAGDELLRQAAKLLKDSARADDVVGRLGGDELALLLVEQTREGADTVTQRITEELPARRAAIGFEATWDLTIGVASFPEDGDKLEDLLRVADRRLYEQRGIALH
jgi:diguanylate cyclase (GGDEF)-like protein